MRALLRWAVAHRLPVAAGVTAVVLAVGLTVLLAPGDEPRSPSSLAQESASATPQPPSPTLTAHSAAASAEPTPGTGAPTPSTSSSAAPRVSPAPEVAVSGTAMLSHDYVSATFGQGRPALAQQSDDAGPQWTCDAARPVKELSRSWAWTGETGVAEVLAEYDGAPEAAKQLAACREEPLSEAAVRRDVDVADGGFLAWDRRTYTTVQLAGARVGGGLVLLSWVQSGPVPSSDDALLTALRAAVARATGGDQRAPGRATTPATPDLLRGMVSRTQLSDPAWPRLDWLHDDVWTALEHAGRCGDPITRLESVTTPVYRVLVASPGPGEVVVSRGRAADVADAERQFAACKGDRPTVPDVGDDGFRTSTENNEHLFVRAGATFYVVWLKRMPTQDLVAVGRAVVAADTTSAS